MCVCVCVPVCACVCLCVCACVYLHMYSQHSWHHTKQSWTTAALTSALHSSASLGPHADVADLWLSAAARVSPAPVHVPAIGVPHTGIPSAQPAQPAFAPPAVVTDVFAHIHPAAPRAAFRAGTGLLAESVPALHPHVLRCVLLALQGLPSVLFPLDSHAQRLRVDEEAFLAIVQAIDAASGAGAGKVAGDAAYFSAMRPPSTAAFPPGPPLTLSMLLTTGHPHPSAEPSASIPTAATATATATAGTFSAVVRRLGQRRPHSLLPLLHSVATMGTWCHRLHAFVQTVWAQVSLGHGAANAIPAAGPCTRIAAIHLGPRSISNPLLFSLSFLLFFSLSFFLSFLLSFFLSFLLSFLLSFFVVVVAYVYERRLLLNMSI